MSEDLIYNRYYYFKKTSKPFVSILIIIILSIVIVSGCIKFEKKINIKALTICENTVCSLKFYQYNEEKYAFTKIRIEKKEYKVKSLSLGEVQMDATNSFYQEVELELENYSYKNNEIVNIDLINSNKSLLKLVIDVVKER